MHVEQGDSQNPRAKALDSHTAKTLKLKGQTPPRGRGRLRLREGR